MGTTTMSTTTMAHCLRKRSSVNSMPNSSGFEMSIRGLYPLLIYNRDFKLHHRFEMPIETQTITSALTKSCSNNRPRHSATTKIRRYRRVLTATAAADLVLSINKLNNTRS